MSFAVLEQSGVILSFVFEGQAGRVRCIVICINSAPTQMIDGTEKPIRKRAARYNEFGYKACGYLVCCCCQLLLLNHNFRLRYLILSVSNPNFNLFNLIFGLILPVGYLKTSRMAEHIYNVHL